MKEVIIMNTKLTKMNTKLTKWIIRFFFVLIVIVGLLNGILPKSKVEQKEEKIVNNVKSNTTIKPIESTKSTNINNIKKEFIGKNISNFINDCEHNNINIELINTKKSAGGNYIYLTYKVNDNDKVIIELFTKGMIIK